MEYRVWRLIDHVQLAFHAFDHARLHGFHEAALAAGAHDSGVPGERPCHPGYRAVYALDPDGNNIASVFHGPASRPLGSLVVGPE